jgi:hypothetical protein
MSSTGYVAGYSRRYIDVNTDNGRDAWVWNGTTTAQVGLTRAANTGSNGYRYSYAPLLNAAGQAAGYSERYTATNTDNGLDAWVWNGTTTIQIGLLGGTNTTSSGFQYSIPSHLNGDGQVAGTSWRLTSNNRQNGLDAWVWNGAATIQIGLVGPGYTAASGYQYSDPEWQSAAGQVAGYSYRVADDSTQLGRDAWVWTGTSTVVIGLTGPDYTSNGGYRYGKTIWQNASGRVAGYSRLVHTYSGQDTWQWNGEATVQIGLTGAVYTGSDGHRFSWAAQQNAAGQVAGYTHRITGVSTENGQDTWYYDPVSDVSTAIVGSVRVSDNYAYSEPTVLTADGYLLGRYSFFAGGVGPGEDRAFAFRPDLGLIDLGELVSGGLAAAGWSTLYEPEYSDMLRAISGTGLTAGQAGGRSVFLMIAPTGACCRGSMCERLIQTECVGPSTRFAGVSVACNAPGNSVTPCCHADYNQSGGPPTIQDVFDYLAAYFASDARADINGVGGVTVQDIFDYLTAYFAGCP